VVKENRFLKKAQFLSVFIRHANFFWITHLFYFDGKEMAEEQEYL